MVGGEDRRQPDPRRPGRGGAARDGLARHHDLGLCVEDGGDEAVVGGAVAGVVGVTEESTTATKTSYKNSRSPSCAPTVRSRTKSWG